MRPASDWFNLYRIAVMACASVCILVLNIAPRRVPARAADPYRAAADKLIADALPPSWTTRHSIYIISLHDADGNARAFAYTHLAANGRPQLAARPIAATKPCPPPAAWDLTDPRTPDAFKAWLTLIARRPGVERVSSVP